jgi:hypothetical protein
MANPCCAYHGKIVTRVKSRQTRWRNSGPHGVRHCQKSIAPLANKPKLVVKSIYLHCKAGFPVLSVNSAVIIENDMPFTLTALGLTISFGVNPPDYH